MANKKLHDAFHATTKPINSGVKMAMNLRKYARGKPCMVCHHGCNYDEDTTVLAHRNGGGGTKHHDFLGAAWACSNCHRWLDVDYVNQGYSRDERDELHEAAINLTQQELLKTANKHGVTLAEAIEEWAKGLEL